MEDSKPSTLNHTANSQLLSRNVEKEIHLQKIRDKLHKLKTEVLSSFEEQISEKMETFLQDVEQIESSSLSNGNVSSKTNKKNDGELSAKVHVDRRSVLSELLEINHIRSIYHIFVAILIVFMLNTFAFDVLDKGRVELDFSLILYSFGKFPLVITVWLCMMFGTAIVVYSLFQYWAYSRKPGKLGWFDMIWVFLYVSYQVLFLYLPVRTILQNSMPAASTVLILTEQVRLVMKAHAFVRENVPRVLNHTGKKDEILCPDFTKYLYFLFAPTLIYRDDYPKIPGPIRWNYVVSNFTQVLACIFYMYYIFERFCIPIFKDFNQQYMTLRYFSVSVFSCMLPGTLVQFITFFAILHSWLNAFAEMLRFGDRLFYKDWWNSTSFSNYYRTWNVVVHDWLYTYVYQDLQRVFGKSCRPFLMGFVFLLSAVVHEYILSITFGFFYPILFFMFAGAGFGFIFLPNKSQRSGNVFVWVALFIGNGLLMCLYCMEWYARIRCPSHTNSYLDYLIPRSWNCNITSPTYLPVSYFSNNQPKSEL